MINLNHNVPLQKCSIAYIDRMIAEQESKKAILKAQIVELEIIKNCNLIIQTIEDNRRTTS